MPLRFASAHRFFMASEIRLLPSVLRRPRAEASALVGDFRAALTTRAFTASFARTTELAADSSNPRSPRALAGHCSITFDSNASTLFNRLRAFLAFIVPPEDRPCYHPTQHRWDCTGAFRKESIWPIARAQVGNHANRFFPAFLAAFHRLFMLRAMRCLAAALKIEYAMNRIETRFPPDP